MTTNTVARDGRENAMNRPAVDSGVFYAIRTIAAFYAAAFAVGWVIVKVFS